MDSLIAWHVLKVMAWCTVALGIIVLWVLYRDRKYRKISRLPIDKDIK